MYDTLVKPLESVAAGIIESIVDAIDGGPADLRRPKEIARLPQDLYAHSDVQTEWWYYTGHCRTESGREFGFEFVFFKRQTDMDNLGIVPVRAVANPMYFAHFAVSDITQRAFRYRHLRSFAKPFDLPVSMSKTSYDLKLGAWSITENDGRHILHADLGPDLTFDAELSLGKPIVHNGDGGNGISRKYIGSSAHFSYTRMPLTGTLLDKNGTESFKGTAWMDREFGTFLQPDWDWFSIQLDDETELMIYQYRSKGDLESDGTGTFVRRNGECSYLSRSDYTIKVTDHWKSEASGAEYPAAWTVDVPSHGLHLNIRPYIADQELDTRGTTMIVYWEGACSVTGTKDGDPIAGRAYVELVGYDRSHERAGIGDLLFGEQLRWIRDLFS